MPVALLAPTCSGGAANAMEGVEILRANKGEPFVRYCGPEGKFVSWPIAPRVESRNNIENSEMRMVTSELPQSQIMKQRDGSRRESLDSSGSCDLHFDRPSGPGFGRAFRALSNVTRGGAGVPREARRTYRGRSRGWRQTSPNAPP